MNGPIENIARELGFEGYSFLEGLVVSIFIVGAFIGSISSASLIDKFGCKRTLQIDTIPLILGALIRFVPPIPLFVWISLVRDNVYFFLFANNFLCNYRETVLRC